MKLCIRVTKSSQGYIASCPSLPGCRCLGTTCQDVLRGMDEAIRGYIAALGSHVPGKLETEVLDAPPEFAPYLQDADRKTPAA